MDFFRKNLEETIKAINILRKKNDEIITVKKIRLINHIKSSNRSKINFIWRSLQYLYKKNILELIKSKNPKSYKLLNKNEIKIEDIYRIN